MLFIRYYAIIAVSILFLVSCESTHKTVLQIKEPDKSIPIAELKPPDPQVKPVPPAPDPPIKEEPLEPSLDSPKNEDPPNSVESITVESIEEEEDNSPIEEPSTDDPSLIKKRNPEVVFEEALDFCQAAQDFWQKGEPENAIEALDQAYALILDVEIDDNPKLLQEKEDIRFTISKRILEIYTSRHIVVNGKQNEIPLTINSHVQEEINHFSIGREKNFFLESYARSGRFRPYIIKAFTEAGLPPELSWMPLIESGFKVNAFSKARALGLWQFISSTGYKYGLKRTTHIDERLDPIKSTEAAIAYLKELHQIFGDWTTVMAAYNCGEHRVLRVIREQNVNYLDNFWDLYERLPRETARYVPRFLATLHMINNPGKFGLDAVPLETPMTFEIAIISKQIRLNDIARKIDVPEQQLKQLNPELRHQLLPGERYPLRVPAGRSQTLLAVLDDIPTHGPPRLEYAFHRIKRGETLSTIAKRYHASVGSIARINNIRGRGALSVGKMLKIPQQSTSAYTQSAEETPPLNLTLSHTVKAGDSLFNLAKRYGTTIDKIRQVNDITGAVLHVGQILKIPGQIPKKPASEPDTGKLKIHVVRRGDTPLKIATQYNMPLEKFLKINGLKPKSKIYPKQKMLVE